MANKTIWSNIKVLLAWVGQIRELTTAQLNLLVKLRNTSTITIEVDTQLGS